MNKIFSANDPDAIERLRDNTKQNVKKTEAQEHPAAARRLRSSGGALVEAATDILSAQNRLVLRNERMLQGLLAVKELLDRPQPTNEKEAELNALIARTRFQDEPVLADYSRTLRTAIRDNDRAAVDYLVMDFQNRLQGAARDRIIRENLSAASSLIPADLLKDVVRSIKSEGLPEISIARQRVLDLLKNS
jgi:capsid protein